jgi:hypothetical protein
MQSRHKLRRVDDTAERTFLKIPPKGFVSVQKQGNLMEERRGVLGKLLMRIWPFYSRQGLIRWSVVLQTEEIIS